MSLPDRTVLLFSAGKDSLATLLMLRRYWDNITLLWAKPGEVSAEVLLYMERIAGMGLKLIVTHGNSREWIERNGWPVDAVPVRWTDAPHGAEPKQIRFAPYTDCCAANMWQPLGAQLDAMQAELVITGQKHSDELRNRAVNSEFSTINGRRWWCPLHDWTDAQVFAYLREQGATLPPGYADGERSSRDCWYCTAYLDHSGQRLRNMRERDPENFAAIEPVLYELRHAMQETAKSLEFALKE